MRSVRNRPELARATDARQSNIDYYPVVARAVSRLEDNTPAQRRSVYDRARKVLVDQLQSREPPATSEEIRSEQLALDAALRKVEDEHGEVKSSSGREPRGANQSAWIAWTATLLMGCTIFLTTAFYTTEVAITAYLLACYSIRMIAQTTNLLFWTWLYRPNHYNTSLPRYATTLPLFFSSSLSYLRFAAVFYLGLALLFGLYVQAAFLGLFVVLGSGSIPPMFRLAVSKPDFTYG